MVKEGKKSEQQSQSKSKIWRGHARSMFWLDWHLSSGQEGPAKSNQVMQKKTSQIIVCATITQVPSAHLLPSFSSLHKLFQCTKKWNLSSGYTKLHSRKNILFSRHKLNLKLPMMGFEPKIFLLLPQKSEGSNPLQGNFLLCL